MLRLKTHLRTFLGSRGKVHPKGWRNKCPSARGYQASLHQHTQPHDLGHFSITLFFFICDLLCSLVRLDVLQCTDECCLSTPSLVTSPSRPGWKSYILPTEREKSHLVKVCVESIKKHPPLVVFISPWWIYFDQAIFVKLTLTACTSREIQQVSWLFPLVGRTQQNFSWYKSCLKQKKQSTQHLNQITINFSTN